MAASRAGPGGYAKKEYTVAVMIIGRTLESSLMRTPGAGVSLSRGETSIVDLMVADEEEEEEVSGEAGQDAQSLSVPEESAWASFKQYVLGPLTADLGRQPDVFVCTDEIVGASPPEVTTVFKLKSGGQYDKAAGCYERVKNRTRALRQPRYDFYIKSRPDFVYLRDFPNIAHFHRMHLYARFRSAMGIAGLTSAHVSWQYCQKQCNGRTLGNADAFGYIVDDMVFVAPASVAEKVFMPPLALVPYREAFVPPPGWISMQGFTETKFTTGLIGAGVLAEPLAIVGYPSRSKHDHKSAVAACRDVEVPKQCGRTRSIAEVNKALQESRCTGEAGCRQAIGSQ